MPVRRPRGGLKGKRKRTTQASHRVRGIRNEAGWNNAMQASERAYLVVRVVAPTNNMYCQGYRNLFATLSNKKELKHMIFAEVPATICEDLREWQRSRPQAKHPVVLVYHQHKCIKEFTADSSIGNAGAGVWGVQAFANHVQQELQSIAGEAPRSNRWWMFAKAGFALVSIAAGASFTGPIVMRRMKPHSGSNEVEEKTPQALKNYKDEWIPAYVNLQIDDDFDFDNDIEYEDPDAAISEY